jgi:site-specific recombinase XerD
VPALVPVFTSEELSAIRRACQGRSFEARRDAAIIEVLLATGVRLRKSPGSVTFPVTRPAAT